MAASHWWLWRHQAYSDSRRLVRPAPRRRPLGLERLEDRCVPSAGAEALARLPLTFEANVGQADPTVRYLAHGSGYNLALTDQGATLDLSNGNQTDVLMLQLVGGNAAPSLSGLNPQAGVANYLIGSDSSQWHTNVPLFGKVEYQQVYPGVDMVFYGNSQQQLEYDLDLAPGADPSQVRLRFAGQQGLDVDGRGDLIVHLSGGDVVQQTPVVYQEDLSGSHTLVTGRYVLNDDGTVGVALDGYDAARPVVIDPVLSYSTYLGGNGSDSGYGVAVDGNGNAYITGLTGSTNFPTANSVQAALGDVIDAFVTKLNTAGTALVYSTYLGGSGANVDIGYAIAVDSSGSAYVTGFTNSPNFPTAHAYQPNSGGGTGANSGDAFVSKLNPAGNALVYSTYLGGSGEDYGQAIAVDGSGNAYVTGYTRSSDFPTAATIGTINSSNKNIFVVKFNATGSALDYSILIGGSTGFSTPSGIAIDSAGSAYITGNTAASNFPVSANAVQPTFGGVDDAFVAKLDPAGDGLLDSTYLGGSSDDYGLGIALDAFDNVYITGSTSSTDFPTAHAVQGVYGGGTSGFRNGDAFVTKLSPSLNSLVYSTYLGGSGADSGQGIAVDLSGNAYIIGTTASANFPTAAPLQATYGGNGDAFVAKLNPSGAILLHSTYLGGSSGDQGGAIAVDELGGAYVTGYTTSTDFPTANAFQPTYGGGTAIGTVGDAFVTKLTLDPPTSGPLILTAPSGNGPNNLTLRLRVSGLGNIVELLDNNVLVAAQLLANTPSVQITCAAGVANRLTIDNTFGGLIPLPITFTGGAAGSNSVTITGTSAADSLALSPAVAVLNSSETVSLSNVQSVTGLGAANDAAYLYDQPGVNTFLSTPAYSVLSGNGYSLAVGGFGSIQANAGANASDSASLYDTVGGGVFVGRTDYSYLRIGALINQVVGFKSVLAGITPGLNDSAFLIDPKGGAAFTAYPGYSYLLGAGVSVTAQKFTQVKAYAPTGSSDSATLIDNSGGGQFTGYPGYSYLQVGSYFNTAVGFPAVTAYAPASSADAALLIDNAGGGAFTGYFGYSFLINGVFSETAVNFPSVTAANQAGGNDSATLYDNVGGGGFSGGPAYGSQPASSIFVHGAYSNQALGFASVTAVDQVGRDPKAYLYGAAAPGVFEASPNSADFRTPDYHYFLVVSGFIEIQAISRSGGDSAGLHDSAGDDIFSGAAGDSFLESAANNSDTYKNDAVGFAQVFAYSTTGTDHATLTATGSNNGFVGLNDTSLLTGANYSIQVFNFFDVKAMNEGSAATAYLFDTFDNDVLSVVNSEASLYSTTHSGMNYIVNVLSFNVSATATGMNDVAFGLSTSTTTTTSGFQQAQLGQQPPNPPGGR
jgi:hypothetical protein